MKLSEAIRKGTKARPQCQDAFFDYIDGGVLGNCTLGAAYEGYTGAPSDNPATVYRVLVATFPGLEQYNAHQCPACDDKYDLFATITHLNDVHRWTREAIADWIAQVEANETV